MRRTDPARGQHILEVAAKLFAHRHYHQVRMEDVAGAAGVAKGTLYRYFQDKEDLYLGLILLAIDRLYHEVRAGIELTPDPEEKLLFYVRSSVNFFTRHPYFFDLVQRIETTGTRKKVAALSASRDRFFKLIGEVIEGLVDRKQRLPAVELLVLFLTGIVRQVLRFHPQPFPPELAEWIVQQFLHGLGAPVRPQRNGHARRTLTPRRRKTPVFLNN